MLREGRGNASARSSQCDQSLRAHVIAWECERALLRIVSLITTNNVDFVYILMGCCSLVLVGSDAGGSIRRDRETAGVVTDAVI